MFAVISAILFGVAFVLHGAASTTSIWFSPASLALLGLFCLALHLCGVGAGWTIRRQ